MGFEINLNKVLGQLTNTKSSKTEKADSYSTIPMTSGASETKDVSWKESMGLNLHTSKPAAKNEAVFSDADLAAFVNTYATNISEETAANVTESMNAITSVNFNELNAIPEEFQDAYMGQQVDGTADRVKNDNKTRLFASDIDDAVNGDPELLDIAGYIFDDAAARRAA